VRVVRVELVYFVHPARVYFVDDLHMARQESFDKVYRPFFESLRQQRVVCVCENFRAHAPRFVPRQAVNVHQEAHKLGNGDGGVGVVKLNDDLVCKFRPVLVFGKVAAYDVLKRAGHEEILLHKAQIFSVFGFVVGV